MPDLQQKLSEPGVIILDGATGTQLQKMGLPPGMAPEIWNLENPEAIKKHHLAYIEAGCDAILTNSFGGNRPRLDLEGKGHLINEINIAAAKLAREVAGDDVLVLGSVGPTGLLMQPMGELSYDKAVEYFAEQATALAEGGVDGIHIETMSDLQEAKAAIAGVQQATDLLVTITLSFDTHGCTMMGLRPEDAVKELSATGVAAVGANCGRTLDENLTAITAMRTAMPDMILVSKPNAGMPSLDDSGEAVYEVTPDVMADYALKFGGQHVKMLGACCGSTPDHIKVIKESLKNFTPPPLEQVLAENQTAAAVADNGSQDKKRRQRSSRRRKK